MSLSTITEHSVVAISRADSIISEFDIERATEESGARLADKPNIKILHTIQSEYKIDGRRILGKPLGHFGSKLELKTIFITAATPHVDALVSAVEGVGVEVMDYYAGPAVESMVTLTPTARNAGTVVCNIGAETLSLITYEDTEPTSLKVFPIGSVNITNDIALGLRVTLEEAERQKLTPPLDRKVAKKVSEIIEARLSDMLELIDTHLRKIGRSSLLPAGIVFTGGAARTEGLVALAKSNLGLPARVGENILPGQNIHERIKDPEWSVVAGLCLIGLSDEPSASRGWQMARKTKTGVMKFLKQFLP